MSNGAPSSEVAPASQRQRFRLTGVVGGLIGAILVTIAGLVFVVSRACACSTATTPPLPASPVDGVVVSVEAASLGQVKSFNLRTSNGVVYTLKLGNLENATEFSPSHLAEHQATSEPIRAYYRLENGVPVVYRVEDAPG